MRALRWLPALLPLGLVWVLATESGLGAVASAAEALTGHRLQFTGPSGSLLGVVGFDRVVYEHPSATVSLTGVRLDVRLTRLLIARVQAESVTASVLTVTTHAHPPSPQRQPLTVLMPLRIAVEEGALKRFDLELDDGRHKWGVSDVNFRARWLGQWIVIGKASARTREAGPVELRGRVALIDDLLQLEDIEIEGSGQLKVKGALAMADSASNTLDVSWKNPLRWSGLQDVESASGHAHLEGPWKNYGWNLDAQLAGYGVAGKLEGRGRGSLEKLLVHRLQLAALGGEVRGGGELDWKGALRSSATLQFERINPGLRFEGWDGVLAGDARLEGVWEGKVPQLEFDARLRESKLRGYPLTLAVRGSTRERKLDLSELLLTSGASKVKAQGRLMPEFGLRGEIASTDLQSLWAGLSGSANLRATLDGTPAAPRLGLHGTAADFEYRAEGGRGYRAARARIEASLAPAARSEFRVELDDVELGLAMKRLRLQGHGTVARHNLRLESDGEEGSASLELEGGYAKAQWQGRVRNFRLVPAGDDKPWLQEAEAELQLAAGHWRLARLCLDSGQTRVCAESQSAAGRQSAAVELRDLDLRNLKYWLPSEWKLSGTVSGTASLRARASKLEDLRADLRGSPGRLDGAGVKLEFSAGTLRIEPEGERLHGRLQLAPAGGEVAGDVWLAPGAALLDRPLSGQLHARVPDLSWLPVLSPEIAGASGSLDAQLALSGTLRAPAIEGRVAVGDARVQLATPGIELTDISAVFESGSKVPLGVLIKARSGGGTLTLEGGIERTRPQLKGHFKLTGEGAQWINTAEVRAWVSPRLELDLSGKQARLTGDIVVPRAGITPRDFSSGGVAPTGDQLLVESGGAGRERAWRLESDVRIVLGNEVRFNGLGLKTRLEGSIGATDQPGRPTRAVGELRLVGGRYRAYGQNLTIETGRLLFTGGLLTDPGIELQAYRDLDSCGESDAKVRVGLRARGSLAAPAFSLYSDPAKTQEEQLSCLVLGRPLSETLQSGQKSELDSAASALGLAGGEYLANQLLAPRLGIDQFSVDTRAVTTAPGQTTEQTRLMLGKYLSPRLFVSYGFGLFQPGRFFRLQYDLGHGFKLSGESGDVQSGDVVYTIER